MHALSGWDNGVAGEVILVNSVIGIKIEDALPGAIPGAFIWHFFITGHGEVSLFFCDHSNGIVDSLAEEIYFLLRNAQGWHQDDDIP